MGSSRNNLGELGNERDIRRNTISTFVCKDEVVKETQSKNNLPTSLERARLAARLIVDNKGEDVRILDLREIFAGTAQLVSEYFFSSDHHWTYDAAFIAAEMVAAKIVRCLNLRISYDNDILKRSEWHVRRLPLWRSGSHAGRTGTLFAGVDDLDYREPAEKVKVRCVMYDREGMEHIREGDFSDVFVAKNVVNRRNWHVGSAYVVFPRVDIVGIFNNQSAPLPTKIVILGDSFARPIPAYLTSTSTTRSWSRSARPRPRSRPQVRMTSWLSATTGSSPAQGLTP